MKTGNEIGMQILQAAGIPADNVYKVELSCEAGKAAVLTVRAYLKSMPLADLTTQYRIEQITHADRPPVIGDEEAPQ